jgi:hypothetical protein
MTSSVYQTTITWGWWTRYVSSNSVPAARNNTVVVSLLLHFVLHRKQGVPFEYSVAEGVELFNLWATAKLPLLSTPHVVSLTPYYLPFWSFETDTEVTVKSTRRSRTVDRTARPSTQVWISVCVCVCQCICRFVSVSVCIPIPISYSFLLCTGLRWAQFSPGNDGNIEDAAVFCAALLRQSAEAPWWSRRNRRLVYVCHFSFPVL